MDFYFILMAPARAENVGAAARALKTMGFSKLRIVASDVHLRDEAQWVAHGAQALLAQAETFETLDAALADLDLVVATTARQRGTFHRYLAPAEVCVQIENKRDSLSKVGILFGCEASGLSNEQIAQADLISYLPLRVGYPSLNLGQAVMLYAWELSALDERLGQLQVAPHQIAMPADGEVHALQRKLSDLLGTLQVSQDEKLYEWVVSSVAMLAQRDLNLLHLLCKDLERALKGVHKD